MGPLLWPRCRLKGLRLWLLHDGDVVRCCCLSFLFRVKNRVEKKKRKRRMNLPRQNRWSTATHTDLRDLRRAQQPFEPPAPSCQASPPPWSWRCARSVRPRGLIFTRRTPSSTWCPSTPVAVRQREEGRGNPASGVVQRYSRRIMIARDCESQSAT